MTGFGESVRVERERLALSLEQVCARTKISERQLEAIEAERYGELPAGVFRRGMVRAYLDALELDQDQWMPRFQQSYEQVMGPEPELSAQKLAEFAENIRRNRTPVGQRNSLRWLGVVFLLLLLCAAGYAVWRLVLEPRLHRAGSFPPPSAAPAAATTS